MGKSKHISAVISLKDNMSATMRDIRQEQKQFQKDLTRTRNQMRKANREKLNIKLDSTSAHAKIQKLQAKIKPLRKKVITYIAAKDLAKERIRRVKSDLKGIGRFIAKPAIKVKDQVTGRLGKIKSALMSFKGMAVVAGIAAGGKALLGGGMELEQQKISMQHFMGVGNKGKSQAEIKAMSGSYVKQLRNNANATPFETGEVMQVGARALQLSGGNAKEAMKQVKLAEDMAAMNPGKSVSDAMEALADAKTGEMERLKEFGLKASSKDSYESVQGKLGDMYAGGAEKLAQSGTGLLSTIMGKAKSAMADIGEGMLEPLKPVMQGIIGGMDSIMPHVMSFGQTLTSGIAGVISFFQSQAPTIGPMFSAVGDVIGAVAPVIGSILQALQPVFSGLLSVASAVFTGIAGVVQTVAPMVGSLIQGLSPVFSAVGSALRGMGSVFSSVFNTVKSVVQGAYNFIKPIVEKIGSAISTISNGISSARNFLSGGGGVDQNATGTSYFRGGWTTVGEHGPELMKLPSGSQIFSNSTSNDMLKGSGRPSMMANNSKVVNIAKIAENIYISKDVNVNELFAQFMGKLNQVGINAV